MNVVTDLSKQGIDLSIRHQLDDDGGNFEEKLPLEIKTKIKKINKNIRKIDISTFISYLIRQADNNKPKNSKFYVEEKKYRTLQRIQFIFQPLLP